MRDPRPKWRAYFLDIARLISTRGDCTRRQVGCVYVDEFNRIVATGYNGVASGMPGCLSAGACPRGRLSYEEVAGLSGYDDPETIGFCHATHAEANGIVNAVGSLRNTTAYITDPPCPGCRKLMAAAGVKAAIWPDGELHGTVGLLDFRPVPASAAGADGSPVTILSPVRRLLGRKRP